MGIQIVFIRRILELILMFCILVPLTVAESAGRNSGVGSAGFDDWLFDKRWPDYEILIWQQQTSARLGGLARLGVTAGKMFGERRGGGPDRAKISEEAAPFLTSRLRWYIENIATDFYAPYHRWHPDHPVTWLFDETQRLHRQDPANITAFYRTPSLSDPNWLRRISQRLRAHVLAYAPYHPLYYSLADEAGIADLGAAWDFDFSPASLADMRIWLRGRYRSLVALNREWGTRFPRWDAVMPMTTDAALQRPDENFAAWADFKEWMDVAFSRAVRAGTDAVHAADAHALSALEGAQIPGWGGYDYSLLGGAVDVMEMYDSGGNIEIARSLFPRLITLMTSSLADPEQIHAVWHNLLLGGRGLILWDEDNALVNDDGSPSDRGQALHKLATELCRGVAAQLIASVPQTDPVAILYSPESFRIQWLLDRKRDGRPWADRRSETEGEDNLVRAAMRRASRLLNHLGLQPLWLTEAAIAQGALQRASIRVLVMPHTIALSPEAAAQIRAFAATGGIVLADSEPGVFDAHGRRLAQPLLADLTGPDGPVMLRTELQADDPVPLARMRRIILEKAGVAPGFSLTRPDDTEPAGIDARVFRNGKVTIFGLQREWATANLGVGQDIELGFKKPMYAYDLLRPGPPQHAAHIKITLDAVSPALIAIASAPLPAIAISGPTQTRLGGAAEFAIVTTGANPAAEQVLHIEAFAPDGSAMPAYTTNLSLRGTQARWRLNPGINGPFGNWIIRVTDVLSGQKIEHPIMVLSR